MNWSEAIFLTTLVILIASIKPARENPKRFWIWLNCFAFGAFYCTLLHTLGGERLNDLVFNDGFNTSLATANFVGWGIFSSLTVRGKVRLTTRRKYDNTIRTK